MWKKTKKIYNRLSLITIAIVLIFFFIYAILTFVVEGHKGNLDSITFVSLAAVIISFPGMVNAIADDFNPRKKKFKVSCECPNCNHIINMYMKEE